MDANVQGCRLMQVQNKKTWRFALLCACSSLVYIQGRGVSAVRYAFLMWSLALQTT